MGGASQQHDVTEEDEKIAEIVVLDIIKSIEHEGIGTSPVPNGQWACTELRQANSRRMLCLR